METELQKEKHDNYLDFRRQLSEGEIAAAQTYDKHLVWFTGGAIAGTIAFIEQFVVTRGLWLFSFAICLFALTIVLILMSLLLGQFAWRKQIEIWDHQYHENKVPEGGNKFTTIGKWLNIMALLSFSAGLVIVLIAAQLNLKTGVAS